MCGAVKLVFIIQSVYKCIQFYISHFSNLLQLVVLHYSWSYIPVCSHIKMSILDLLLAEALAAGVTRMAEDDKQEPTPDNFFVLPVDPEVYTH